MPFSPVRHTWYSRLISACLIVTFVTSMVITPKASLAGVMGLPAPGAMVNLSPAYMPLMITGLTVHPKNPLLMDFIVSTGNSGMDAGQIKIESDRLIKYFLACLTIPENNQWVNLSPYEKQRIVPEDLGNTVLGQDMLAQDYILKQLTASLIYPEKNLGKNFWDKVYSKASQIYGTTQIPVNTFNKVWILPDTAKVYQHNNTVFVVKSHLKVMLDEDYLALSKNLSSPKSNVILSEAKDLNRINSDMDPRLRLSGMTSNLASNIVRQIVLPAIEEEINQGQNFAQMRQIYNSMILAVWFKKNLKEALLNQVYTDKSKVNGVNVSDPSIKEKIYKQYLEAYKKGVFNYIKEDVQRDGQTIPRKYFSGGLTPVKDFAMASETEARTAFSGLPVNNTNDIIRVQLSNAGKNEFNAAMTAREQELAKPYTGKIMYHILTADDYRVAEDMGYVAVPKGNEFLHFATNEQVLAVANNKYLSKAKALVVLRIETKDLIRENIGMDLKTGTFPHYYADLSLSAVSKVINLQRADDKWIATPGDSQAENFIDAAMSVDEARARLQAVGWGNLFDQWWAALQGEKHEQQRNKLLAQIGSLDWVRTKKLRDEVILPVSAKVDLPQEFTVPVHRIGEAGEQEIRQLAKKEVLEAYNTDPKKSKFAVAIAIGGSASDFRSEDPKGMFLGTPFSRMTLFEGLVKKIQAAAKYYGHHKSFPIVIMTSDVTDEKTRQFFIDNDWFGMKDRIFIAKAGVMPLFDAKMKEPFLNAKGEIATGGTGHGDIFDEILVRKDVVSFLDDLGVEVLQYMNADNQLNPIADERMIGYGQKTWDPQSLDERAHISLGVLDTDDSLRMARHMLVKGDHWVTVGQDKATKFILDNVTVGDPSFRVVWLKSLKDSQLTPWRIDKKKVVDFNGNEIFVDKLERASDYRPRRPQSPLVQVKREDTFYAIKKPDAIASAETFATSYLGQSNYWKKRLAAVGIHTTDKIGVEIAAQEAFYMSDEELDAKLVEKGLKVQILNWLSDPFRLPYELGGIYITEDWKLKFINKDDPRLYFLNWQKSMIESPVAPNVDPNIHQGKTVLITGGAGYVASGVMYELLTAGSNVVVYDNMITADRRKVLEAIQNAYGKDRVIIVEGDFDKNNTLVEQMKKYHVKGVVHLAAYLAAGVSVRKSATYYYNNVVGSLKVEKAMDEAGVHNSILAGSAGVYDGRTFNKYGLLDETLPTNPLNPYGETKLMMERTLEVNSVKRALNYVDLRFFNLAGAFYWKEIGRWVGERHLGPETHMIPNAEKNYLYKLGPFEVFGDDYPTPDGTNIRDYIHVLDIGLAIVKSLSLSYQAEAEGKRVAETFTLGTGAATSNKQVVETFKDVLGDQERDNFKVTFGPRRAGDPPVLRASSEYAMNKLAWRGMRDLKTSVASAFEFHQQEQREGTLDLNEKFPEDNTGYTEAQYREMNLKEVMADEILPDELKAEILLRLLTRSIVPVTISKKVFESEFGKEDGGKIYASLKPDYLDPRVEGRLKQVTPALIDQLKLKYPEQYVRILAILNKDKEVFQGNRDDLNRAYASIAEDEDGLNARISTAGFVPAIKEKLALVWNLCLFVEFNAQIGNFGDDPNGSRFHIVRTLEGLFKKILGDQAMAGRNDPMLTPMFNLNEPIGHAGYWRRQQVSANDLVVDMFRDYDYRYEKKGEDLNPAIVFRLGLVWAKMALAKAKNAGITSRTVLIARDARKANPQIMDALVAAMRYSGLNVVYIAAKNSNVVTTYSWAVQQFKPLMSIFHTASHVSRPGDVFVRGFKVAIMDEVGGGVKSLTTKEIKQGSLKEIQELLKTPDGLPSLRGEKLGDFRAEDVSKNVVRFNSLVGIIAASNGSLYEFGEALKKSDDPVAVLTEYEQKYTNTQPLRGVRIVVDGSHTESGILTVRTFEKLGAEVIAIDTDIQEIWGEHKADPSVKKNLAALESKIKATGAHFGLSFDLDGDRGAILVPESTDKIAYTEFHSLAPDNLLGVELPSLIDQWGYKKSGKRLAVIRDVLGTFAVNDKAKSLGIDVYQTDAGYVFLKAKKQVLEKEGVVVPVYGERSGHTWLHVSGEIENPLAVAVLFALIAKERLNTKSLNSVLDVYKDLSVPYAQSPRFQPLFHPQFLKDLGESEFNPTSWRYDPSHPSNPPQVIIGLGKDRAIKFLGKFFGVGKVFKTSIGDLKVKEFNSYADPADEGGLNRYADIVFEQDGKFAGRFVVRASSNDPTFVTSYEAPQWVGEHILATDKRRAMIAQIVLGYLRDEKLALVTKGDIATSLPHLTAEEVNVVYSKSNLAPVEADLDNKAMLSDDEALPREDDDNLTQWHNAFQPTGEEGVHAGEHPSYGAPSEPVVVTGEEGASLPGADHAMKGGIDLNSRNLKIASEGQKINMAFDAAMIAQFKRGDFSGVKIQILDVVPVNLMMLLGLKENEGVGQTAKA